MNDTMLLSSIVHSEHINCKLPSSNAGIAQLGEQQTEVLEVACSIHAPGISFCSPSPLAALPCTMDDEVKTTYMPMLD